VDSFFFHVELNKGFALISTCMHHPCPRALHHANFLSNPGKLKIVNDCTRPMRVDRIFNIGNKNGTNGSKKPNLELCKFQIEALGTIRELEIPA
jgi:hypothetical protein